MVNIQIDSCVQCPFERNNFDQGYHYCWLKSKDTRSYPLDYDIPNCPLKSDSVQIIRKD